MTSQNLIIIENQVIYRKQVHSLVKRKTSWQHSQDHLILIRFDFSNITLSTLEKTQH
jgi:hypothetical protein